MYSLCILVHFSNLLFILCSNSLFLEHLEEVGDSLLALPVHRSVGDWLSGSPEKLRRGGGGVDPAELRVVKRSANRLLGDGLTDSLLGNGAIDWNLPHFMHLDRGRLQLGSAGWAIQNRRPIRFIDKRDLSDRGKASWLLLSKAFDLLLREDHSWLRVFRSQANSLKLMPMQNVEIASGVSRSAGSDAGVRSRRLGLAQKGGPLFGKFDSAKDSRLVLCFFLPCLLESAYEAHPAQLGRNLESHRSARCHAIHRIPIDIVGLLILLDDAWLPLPLLGGKEREAPQRLLLPLELQLVVLYLLQKREDVRLGLLGAPGVNRGRAVGGFLEQVLIHLAQEMIRFLNFAGHLFGFQAVLFQDKAFFRIQLSVLQSVILDCFHLEDLPPFAQDRFGAHLVKLLLL